MAGVFVSYRRDDSQGFAGRLTDDLADILGDERVFRDVEILIGSDFTDVASRLVGQRCALVVIRACLGEAVWRFRRPVVRRKTDWVRTEIEGRVCWRKQLIPVLIGGAHMPAADELPSSIRQLSSLQAAELTDRHWDAEVEALADRLQALCPALAENRPSRKQEESPVGRCTAICWASACGKRPPTGVSSTDHCPSMPRPSGARLLGVLAWHARSRL